MVLFCSLLTTNNIWFIIFPLMKDMEGKWVKKEVLVVQATTVGRTAQNPVHRRISPSPGRYY